MKLKLHRNERRFNRVRGIQVLNPSVCNKDLTGIFFRMRSFCQYHGLTIKYYFCSFYFKKCFIFMCMCALTPCVSVYHVCRILWIGFIVSCEWPYGHWDINSGAVEEKLIF